MIALRILVAALSVALIVGAFLSALRTFVAPRAIYDRLTTAVFTAMRHLFALLLRGPRSEEARERLLVFYAPVSLLALPVVWLSCLLIGYTGLFWGLGAATWHAAFTMSRSSLLTPGFDSAGVPFTTVVAFSETMLSLLLAAILVSYLPALYGAYSQREAAVTGLETLAGSPPSPVTMLTRYHRIAGIDRIDEVWERWLAWFELVQESHTSLQPLVFYRSPEPERSWVTAAGAVLDTAALVASTLERPRDPQAELCLRGGYLCLRRIAGSFAIPYANDPAPDAPISVTRAEYDAVYDGLARVGVPLKADREQAWRDFAGWRVNYDGALVALAVLTVAPPAPWSSDRAPRQRADLRRPLKRARAVAATIATGCEQTGAHARHRRGILAMIMRRYV